MDHIQKFLLESCDVRGEVAHMTESFTAIMTQHDYPPFIRHFLGEALLVALLMTNTIKFKGQLTVQFQSEGPLKTIVAKCNHQNHVRGFVEWDELADENAIQKNLGAGQLVVTLAREGYSPYQSIVALQQQTISEALELYFAQSEQLSTKFWCAVGSDSAAGMMLQLLPEDQNNHSSLQREQFWEHAVKLGETLTVAELLKLKNADILHRLYHQEDVRLFEQQPVIFNCTCSLERMQNAIRLMGEEAALDILKTNREIEVNCQYCSNLFAFDKNSVNEIFDGRNSLH